ncbi:RNA polymerase sigma-70 factor [soil metagenome]
MAFENTMDPDYFELFFKENFKPLCAWCQHKFNLEPDTAKEVVHTGFIKLWENIDTLTAKPGLKSYLYQIITNTCLDMLKHEKVREKHARYISTKPTKFAYNSAFNQHDLNQLAKDIEQAMAELPEQMRKVFELSREEGLKYAEIADRLDISIKTVETQMSRALVKLRSKLGHYLSALCIAIFIFLYFF